MKINGTPVKDADEKIVVVVTKNDVRTGTLKEAKSCAAANALCRQTGAQEARVHFSRAYLKQGKVWKRYVVPMALRNEIIAFDRGGKFEPGEYTLAPAQPTMRLDAPNKKKYAYENKKSLLPGTHKQKGKRPKRPYHVVSGVRKRMMADWE